MLRSFFLDAGFLMFGQVYGVKVTRLSWMVFLTFPDYLGKYRLLQEKSREDFLWEMPFTEGPLEGVTGPRGSQRHQGLPGFPLVPSTLASCS